MWDLDTHLHYLFCQYCIGVQGLKGFDLPSYVEDGEGVIWGPADRVFLILTWVIQGDKKMFPERLLKGIVVRTKENNWKQLTKSKRV